MGKRVTLENYRDDPLYPRITKAVAEVLATTKVVAPVDVLMRMGLLEAQRLEDWRLGRIPYLERVILGNLSRLSRILRILRFHTHDLNLKPSLTVYMKWGKGAKHRLRFTKTGDPQLEEAYSRHFVWPGKGPFHPPADRKPRPNGSEAKPGPDQAPRRSVDAGSREELAAVARRWMRRVWVDRGLATIDALHADDFVDHSPAGRGTDRDAYRAGVAELFAAFPDWTATTQDTVIDTSTGKVAIRWTGVGTHRGEFLGMSPTDRQITFRGIEILDVRGGKIVARWGEWDGLDLLEQLRGERARS